MAIFSLARDAVHQTLAIPRLLTTGLLDLVLPPACRFCEGPLDVVGEPSETSPTNSNCHFCSDCLRALSVSELMMRAACQRCGMPPAGISPAPAASEPNSQDSDCQTCRDQEFDFDAVIALWMYRDRVCDAIVASKYGHNAALADALGHRLGCRLSEGLSSEEMGSEEMGSEEMGSAGMGDPPPSEVTFVPSHLFRQISRGGIGTQTLAQAVASQLNVPLTLRLKAIRPIAKQAWLNDDDRKQNVHGAFVARKSYALSRSPKLDDRHILVVDDVLTTGATASEVARVLKNNGAARVTVAVVSRAVRTR